VLSLIGPFDQSEHRRPSGVLIDLLMAVMDSMSVWVAAAGDERRGRAWRDETTARMTAARGYLPYEDLVAAAARQTHVPSGSVATLFALWGSMEPRPDADAVRDLPARYGFVTNCSARLAQIAAGRSHLEPSFVLSAEEAGWYKPDRRIYLEGCRRLGALPERTLYVAGSVHDGDGAAKAGLQAALVRRRDDQPMPSPDVMVLNSLEDVAGLFDSGMSV
jgi:2-haloacid dehalogenase